MEVREGMEEKVRGGKGSSWTQPSWEEKGDRPTLIGSISQVAR